jgi:uncharacterized coiled-coil DUF342 family protein
MSPAEQEDSLSSLEDRVGKAVQLVARLRQERDSALQQVATLEAERRQVRERIEKLLATIDQLSA